jgi:hypothetical protein
MEWSKKRTTTYTHRGREKGIDRRFAATEHRVEVTYISDLGACVESYGRRLRFGLREPEVHMNNVTKSGEE